MSAQFIYFKHREGNRHCDKLQTCLPLLALGRDPARPGLALWWLVSGTALPGILWGAAAGLLRLTATGQVRPQTGFSQDGAQQAMPTGGGWCAGDRPGETQTGFSEDGAQQAMPTGGGWCASAGQAQAWEEACWGRRPELLAPPAPGQEASLCSPQGAGRLPEQPAEGRPCWSLARHFNREHICGLWCLWRD